MSHAALDAAVRARLGLDPAAVGPTAVARAVDLRTRAVRVTPPAGYLAVFETDPAEPDALAAELAVPETWFFRGGRALFDHLAGFLAARTGDDPVRVLALPCSTGEEPYSLAMALFERGVSADRYRVDAVDLSARHLDRAAAGRYNSFAFREAGPDPRPAHFHPLAEGWEVLPHVRAGVRFRAGNATDPNFLAGERPYDLILCRNLFIYLTAEGRAAATAALDRLLAPDGWLCLSPAEADRLPAGRFVGEGQGAFGVYRRAAGGGSRAETAAPRPRPPIPAPPSSPRIAPTVSPPPAPPPSLDTARTLADAGRTADARASAEAVVAADPGRADAHALLGVIHLSDGRAGDAREALRKALYLEPDHPDALAHMAVLCDREGRPDEAARYRDRLARAGREDRP